MDGERVRRTDGFPLTVAARPIYTAHFAGPYNSLLSLTSDHPHGREGAAFETRPISDELSGEVDRLGGERGRRGRDLRCRRPRRLDRRALPQGRGHGRAQVGGHGGAAKGGQVARRQQLDVRRPALPNQPRLQARWLPAQATGENCGVGSGGQEDKELLGIIGFPSRLCS